MSPPAGERHVSVERQFKKNHAKAPEQTEFSLQARRAVRCGRARGTAAPAHTPTLTMGGPGTRRMASEELRIRFLRQRDGDAATIAWVKRTLAIYRSAVLDKSHHASTVAFRRGYIESYCEFKRWLGLMHAYGMSRLPGTVDSPPQDAVPMHLDH